MWYHPSPLLPPGCHPATDGRVHFYSGAGEDAAIAAEQSAQANHTSKASQHHHAKLEALYKAVTGRLLSFSVISFSIDLKPISNFRLPSPGVKWLLPEEEACRGEGWRDWLAGHPGGGENGGLAEGNDRAEAAAGERAVGQNDAGGPGEDQRGKHKQLTAQTKPGDSLVFLTCS